MTRHAILASPVALVLFTLGEPAPAQAPAPVLRLYGVNTQTDVRLVDTNDRIVHVWPTQFGAHGTDLRDDGTLLRNIRIPTSESNGIQRMAFDGTLLWDYRGEPGRILHHDLEPMPNGNVLLIARERKTAAEAIANGRNPATVQETFEPDTVIEVQPTGPTSGVVVWEWHIWDHLIQDFDPTAANFGVVSNHPELLDINYPATGLLSGGTEFNHVNGIDYDPIHDWILVSAPTQNEIWIIDHSTTSAEAAGHTGGRSSKGGDLLYRWGNPAAYRAGSVSAQALRFQHAPRFIPAGYPGAGNVTVFNNKFVLGEQSAVFELELPLDASERFILSAGGSYGPATPVWSFAAPGFYSSAMSSAERLPNGNTLICSARQSWIFEVTPAGQLVWEHRASGENIFQASHTRRTLWASDRTVSAASGGRVDFDLLAGTPAANDTYLLLCSASGTTPGVTWPGVTLPLNVDPFFLVSATYPNSPPVFIRTLGTMGPLGEATAAFTLPAGLVPSGLQLDFAYLRLVPAMLKAASNAVPLLAR